MAIIAGAAAIVFSTSSATSAAPKHHATPAASMNDAAPKSQRIPEPLYFQHATGEVN
jgi:hypothetical protein